MRIYRNNQTLARRAGPAEEEDLRKLVAWSNPFSSVATQLVVGVGTRLGLKATYQSFPEWRRRFMDKLLSPEFHGERRSFVVLAEGHEIRAAMTMVILYAFGQHVRACDLSDIYCDQDLSAIKALRSHAEHCLDVTKPLIEYLQDAPGIWPAEADELRQMMIRIQEIVLRPSGKDCRNAAHRDVDHLLLHWITYFAGCKVDPARPDTPRQSPFESTSSRIVRLLTRWMLGPLTSCKKTECLSWAVLAELAAGARNPRNVATLVVLYYERNKREPVSKQLRRHAEYHLGRRPAKPAP